MNFKQYEPKWQKRWEKDGIFRSKRDRSAKGRDSAKYYVLEMFPYPSGAGLHVGHPEGYTATDIYSRYKRMKGFNVFYPFGTDDNGLPTERLVEKLNKVKSKRMKKCPYVILIKLKPPIGGEGSANHASSRASSSKTRSRSSSTCTGFRSTTAGEEKRNR